jgi:dTDP-glucose 4,6-dehydratase
MGSPADEWGSHVRHLLVTGGAGFIGSNFARYILEKYPDYEVVVYDKLTYAGNPDNLADLRDNRRFTFILGDICDAGRVEEVMRSYKIDAIINFAAESHVDRSLLEPGSFIQTDVYGTYVLLEAAQRFGVERYHQVSTDEVYGEVLSGSSRETDPLETRSPYSASKAGADLMVHAYCVSFGVPATITRGSNNIGPYQYPEKVVPLFITNAIDDIPLPLYGDGSQMRDYQYVLDHCEGIDVVLHKGNPGDIYNLGTGVEKRNIDMARLILKLLGKPESLIQPVRDRPGHDRRYSLDCSKIQQLGWRSRHTFAEALEKTVRWYVDNQWWWRKIKSGAYYEEYYRRQYAGREIDIPLPTGQTRSG